MIQALVDKFDFSNPTFDSRVAMLILIIWVIALGCVIWSILSQRFNLAVKLVFILLVIALPGVGVLVYLPFSLRQDLFPLLGIWRDPS